MTSSAASDVYKRQFLCELGDEEPELTEHQDIRWVAPEDLKSLEWAPADIPAVELLVERFS